MRGGSKDVATSKVERFVIIVNGFQPLTIISKRSILNVEAVLDPPLVDLVGGVTRRMLLDVSVLSYIW